MEAFQAKVRETAKYRSAPHRSAHYGACTTVDLLNEVYDERNIIEKGFSALKNHLSNSKKTHTLSAVAKAADDYKNGKTQNTGFSAVNIVEPS